MTKRKFFIDTDTASDDAVALLMALEYPDVEVLGVSIVSGNMPVEQGSINARYTIELCEKNVPVYVGSDKPMVCLLYTSPSPRDKRQSRMPSSA